MSALSDMDTIELVLNDLTESLRQRMSAGLAAEDWVSATAYMDTLCLLVEILGKHTEGTDSAANKGRAMRGAFNSMIEAMKA